MDPITITMAVVGMVTAVAKIFPIVNTWIAAYALMLEQKAKAEHTRAFAAARIQLGLGDTSGLEGAAGSDNAGKPTTRPDGVEVRPRNGFKILFFFLILFSSCVTRERVQADLWNDDQLPAEVCGDRPSNVFETCQKDPKNLWCFGISRVLKCKYLPNHPVCEGQPDDAEFEQFLPYCDEHLKDYLSMHKDDAASWLERFTRPEKKK